MPFFRLTLLLCILSNLVFGQRLGGQMYTVNRPFSAPLVIFGMRADPSGNIYMANFGDVDYTTPPDARYSTRHHISSYDSNGRFKWQRQYWSSQFAGRGQSFARCPQTGNLLTAAVVDTLPVGQDSVRYSHLRVDCLSPAGRHLWSRLLKYPARIRGYGLQGFEGGAYLSLYLGPATIDSAASLRNRHYVARLRADGSVAFCRELPTVAAEDPALTGKGLNPQGLCTTPRGVIWMGTVEAYNAPVQSLHHVLIELDSNGHNPISHTIYWPYNVLMGVPRYHGGKLYFTGSAYYSTSGQVYRNFVGRISYPDFTLERGITFGIGTQGTLFYGLADHTWDVLSNGEVAISCAGPELRAIGGFTGTSTAFTIRLDTALRVKHAFEYRGICTAPFRSSGEGCLAATSNGRYVAATYLDGPVNQGYWQNGVFAPDTSDRVCNYQHPLALQQPDAFLPGYNLQPPRTLPELPTIALRAEPALWLADSLPQPDMRQVCTPTPARRLGLRLLGPDTTVCQASYTTGILGGMVSIDGAAFVANPGQITFTASGLHTITVFDSCNASNYLSDTLKLVLGGRPVGLPDTTIRACAGDTILVGASPQGPGPFLWRDERGAQVQTTRLGRFVFDDTGRSIIYHKVFYTGSLVCLSTDSQLVAVQPRLPRTLPDTIGLCAGRDTLLDGATWYPAVRDFLWSVPGGLLRDRPYNTSTPGRYRLRFDVGGCAQRDSLYIKTRDTIRLRIVQYGPSEPCRDSVYLIVQTGTASVFGEYAWREDGQPFLPEADGRIHGKRGHTYTAAISNECGPIPIPPFSVAPKPDSCTHILPPPPVLPLKIYNMVTPNGDHKNDYFIVENAPPNAAYQLAVYSRWGARVYNDGYQPTGWPLADTQSGTYFYRLITDKQVFTGWVEVVR